MTGLMQFAVLVDTDTDSHGLEYDETMIKQTSIYMNKFLKH